MYCYEAKFFLKKKSFSTFCFFVFFPKECTNCPGYYPVDEQCSEMTFTFWYTFQVVYFTPVKLIFTPVKLFFLQLSNKIIFSMKRMELFCLKANRNSDMAF